MQHDNLGRLTALALNSKLGFSHWITSSQPEPDVSVICENPSSEFRLFASWCKMKLPSRSSVATRYQLDYKCHQPENQCFFIENTFLFLSVLLICKICHYF